MTDAPDQTPPPAVDRVEQAERFRSLHEGPEPLLIPNPWDAGSAKLLVALGFKALATTSSGFAATLGRLDGYTMDDEVFANAAVIVKAAGADVLFAPGLTDLADIRSVVSSVDRPVNVLALPNGPTVAELAEAGVRRISVGGAFAFAAYGTLIEAATELRDQGTYGYWAKTDIGRSAVKEHFGG